jgi:antirestriction protein
MTNKLTAVDWLINNLNPKPITKEEHQQWWDTIAKAQQMEEEQHSETWKRGSYSLLEHGSGEDFEQYYKETYGSKDRVI